MKVKQVDISFKESDFNADFKYIV